MAKQILAWQCKYCGEIKRSETIALRHEKSCLSNPDAKNCMLCQNQVTPKVRFSLSTGFDGDRKPYCSVTGAMCSRAVSANCHHFKRK